jgi:hypothetical protein
MDWRKKCLPHRRMSRQSKHTQPGQGRALCDYYSKTSSSCITQMDTATAILDGEEYVLWHFPPSVITFKSFNK